MNRIRTRVLPVLLAAVVTGSAASPASSAPAGDGHVEHAHEHPLIRAAVSRPKQPAAPKLPVVNGPVMAATATTSSHHVNASSKVALRVLVLASSATDFGLPTWKSTLDRIGQPYDVILAKNTTLQAGHLVNNDGTAKYNAVLLTDNALSSEGTSAFDSAEWSVLWSYERTYGIRQVSLYTSYGTYPEDYCLRAGTEGPITTPAQLALTQPGSQFFDYLKASARIPVSQSYVYRSRVQSGCQATPLLTVGSDVYAVTSTAPDGRERAALTFSSGEYQLHTDLLGYGLLRWAARGVLIGEQRHYLNLDIDDWFNHTAHLYPDGRLETNPGFRLSGPEASATHAQQNSLRDRYPLADEFNLNIPYNGGGLISNAPSRCSAMNTPDPLSSFSRCEGNNFRWINHTLEHPALDFTTYAENVAEIRDNLAVGRDAGFVVPGDNLKTPAYSGLGVYSTTPDGPLKDFGLTGSNPHLLKAAKDLGVKVLHGNMSFEGHQPPCFNCAITHPLEPAVSVVPDWPVNIGYQVTTPAEETYLYNSLYGPNGQFPTHPRDLTYPEILALEAEVGLEHVLSGSVYVHTFHQGNAHHYAPGKSLAFDWAEEVVRQYSSYYNVPLKGPDWTWVANYAKARSAHHNEIKAGPDVVWDKVTNIVTVSADTTGSLFITGAGGLLVPSERYGTDLITQLGVRPGLGQTLLAQPR
ncbi:hypothetical protein [Kibdelosporangium phytohabitans]|uniref:Agd3-related carbohydrate-binding protein n=1 Tax=Kibdelosporangium phytohabitans TaxID=860235 RepID=UPI000AD9BA9B|nr:hypothetical protein [Kibdelosporangium phytohabitans]MBE1467975.1 hypothetical protein [Kibdelosporangium phytohabitans]